VPNARLALALAARTNWRPGPVLIADPDPVSRARLRGQLTELGWATAEAANGIQASDLLDRAQARVVLLDISVARSCFPLLVDLHTRALRGELLIVMLDDGTAATSSAVRSLSGPDVDPDRLTAMIPPRRKTH
jgi:CheY-like chemotaxis protein